MLIAVLADIHGNLPALEAVVADLSRRRHDRVVDLGDCVSGPLWPAETAAFLAARGWPTVRGNHDRQLGMTPRATMGASDAFAYDALGPAAARRFAALPIALDLGGGVAAFHARPDRDDAYLLEDIAGGRTVDAPDEAVAARIAGVGAGVVLTAHSHRPSLRVLPDARAVLNPGSVGLPAYEDEDPPHVSETGAPFARYAVVEIAGGRLRGADLIAVAYDNEAAARRADANGRPDWAHALRTGRMPR